MSASTLIRRLSTPRLVIGLGVALGSSPLLGCHLLGTAPPDVILITLDTTRVDHLGTYGYERDTSPVIDAFARDAVVYRRAWSTASWTLPAHASILTGRYPTSHGAHFDRERGDIDLGKVLENDFARRIKVNRLAEDEVTLAELLAAEGYATGVFVGGPWLAPPFGLLQGYELQDAKIEHQGGRSAAELTERAISWMEGVPARQPLHLLVNYFDPHDPYDPPDEFRNPATARSKEGSARLTPTVPEREQGVLIEGYDGEIRYMDHHVGKLLEFLRASGRYENALIVVVSDHGELFGEHGLFRHGSWLYEELIRVGLIVRFPGGRLSGTVVDDPISVVDLLPMVAEELGITLPPSVEGVTPGRRRLVLGESFGYPGQDVRHGRRVDMNLVTVIRWPWKLILDDRGGRELYRLDIDPKEQRNLESGPEEAALLKKLSSARSAMAPPERPALPTGVDSTTEKHLRALGYIE